MRKSTKIQLVLLDNLVWVLLAVFFILNVLFTPAFFSTRNMMNILYQSAVLGLMVLGQGIVMMVGELDLSMEAILAFAPGATILLSQKYGLGPLVCIGLTLLIGLGLGWFNGMCVAKLRANSFLMTMSSQIFLRGIVLFLVPFSLANLDPVYSFLGKARIGGLQVAIIVFLLIYVIFELLSRKTVYGRRFLLTGGNRRAAFISGINTDRIMIGAFMLAGVLSALAGIITAGRQNAVSNSMGEGLVMMAFAGAILGGCSFNGGKGKPIGMLGGTLLLGMIDNALNLNSIDVNLVSATKGGLIFLTILLDQLRIRRTANIMHKENVRRLDESSEDKKEEL